MVRSLVALHRGRIQIQGSDLPGAGYSWWWDQRWPPRARTGLRKLRMLRKRLTSQQDAVRDEAFARAERWLRQVRDQGGIPAPVIRTFQNTRLQPKHRDARIDVEVLSGVAFRRSILS
jgi:hypothetical protein